MAVLASLVACLAASSAGADELTDDVAAAFRNSSARAIRAFLPHEGRVYVALAVLDVEEGFVGSDQLYYLFDQLYERATTVSFVVTKSDRTGANTLFLRATWKLGDRDGREHQIRLSMTLSRDESAWAIRELRGGH